MGLGLSLAKSTASGEYLRHDTQSNRVYAMFPVDPTRDAEIDVGGEPTV